MPTPISGQPSEIDPAALRVAVEMLDALGVPRRPKFTPSMLAADLGGTARAWQRRCENGEIGATKIGRGYVVPWRWLVLYIAYHQNLVALN